jgi:hypothetical protein
VSNKNAAADLVRVRVLALRALSLQKGEGIAAVSTLYKPGDELDLPADEAEQLIDDGYVERVQ